ncbi:MAG: hypothetical protein GC201_05140 [Alphaproteobacteria bacterium]|nr:hypothetical protein [Alphaproteobacteria bacterium]
MPLWLAGGGIVLLLGSLYERIHYKRLAGASPGPDWEATAERFVDPETGKLVQVYLKPRTGERTYVVIGDPPAKTPDPS